MSKKKNPLKIFGRILMLLIVAAAVTAILAVTVFRKDINMDSIFRFFTYIGVDMDDDGQFELIKFDSHVTNLYKAFGNSLAVLSSTDLKIFDGAGEESFSQQVFLKRPALEASEKFVVAYDRGGGYLIVVDRRGEIMLETTINDAIARADVNDHGYIALITQESGSRSVVRVFSPNMNEIYRWHSSSRYIVSACISEDGKMLAVGCIGQRDSRFYSSVVTFMLGSEEINSELSIADSLLLSVSFSAQNKICAVTEDKIIFMSSDAENVSEFSYKGMYLSNYAVGHDYAFTLLNRFKSGGKSEASLIDTGASEIYRIKQTEEVIAMSSNDRYIVLLHPDHMVIFTRDMQKYAELIGTQGATNVLIRKDGSAILLDSGSARLFIP